MTAEINKAVERLERLRQVLCSAAFIRDAARAVYGTEAHAETQIPFDIRDVTSELSRLREELATDTQRRLTFYDAIRQALGCGSRPMIDELPGEVARLREENERLHERLEDNFAFNVHGERVAFEPGTIPDGIECRDETIKQQRERITTLTRERDEAREALEGTEDQLRKANDVIATLSRQSKEGGS